MLLSSFALTQSGPPGYHDYEPAPTKPKRRPKPKGQSGPVVDTTPLTKREKRKLRRSL